MSFFSDKRDKTVGPALAKRGAVMIVREETGGSVDVNTGENTPGTTVDHTTKGLINEFTEGELQYDNIQAGDLKIMLAADDFALETPEFVPSTDHILLIAGVAHTIVRAKPFQPGGETVFYSIQVRK